MYTSSTYDVMHYMPLWCAAGVCLQENHMAAWGGSPTSYSAWCASAAAIQAPNTDQTQMFHHLINDWWRFCCGWCACQVATRGFLDI